MTEVVSSLMVGLMLRGLRLWRLRLCVDVCVRVKLLENVLRLSVAVTLEVLTCELRNLLARLRASTDSRDKAIELILNVSGVQCSSRFFLWFASSLLNCLIFMRHSLVSRVRCRRAAMRQMFLDCL